MRNIFTLCVVLLSMLPELTAQSFLEKMKGGRTDPLLVTARTENGIEPFVVKIFTPSQIEERKVQKEVFGNVLAKEFGLPVPEAALIKFTPEFLEILPKEQLWKIEKTDHRIMFATKQCENIPQYLTGLDLSFLQKKIAPDMLFAFDTLIRNSDRTNDKPNLLIGSDTAFVIDHERGFHSIERAKHELTTNNWDMEFSHLHIFYGLLKSKKTATKAEYFNEFHEILRRLKINKLDSYITQLQSHSYQVPNAIRNWLTFAKANSNSFVNILRGAIR